MQLLHFYHHHRVKSLFTSDFWLFEFSVWLHVLARSLITIFVPILLLRIGFDLHDVVIFYLLFHAIDIPLNFAAGRVIERIGARMTMFIANIFTIFFFISLNTVSAEQYWLLGAMAAMLAAYDALYWVSHLYLFMKSDQEVEQTGADTGVLYSVKKIAMMLGPLIGAGLLIYVSQTALIVLSVILFLLSALPLISVTDFADKPSGTQPRYSLRDFFGNHVDRNNFISTGLYAIHRRAELILWPLFLYTLFETIQSVAAVPVIVAATTIIFSFYSSRVNASTRELIIIIGACFVALMWLLRVAIDDATFYYLSVALVSIFGLLIMIPLDSNLFVRAQETDPLSASVYRNTFSMGTATALFLVLLFAIDVFQIAFMTTIISMIGLIAVNFYFLSRDRDDFDALTG